MSSIIDYTDRSTCIIFGDGAGAVLLEPNTDGLGLLDQRLCSDGNGEAYLHQKAVAAAVRPRPKLSPTGSIRLPRRRNGIQVCRKKYG